MKKICVYGGDLVVMLVSLGACGDGKEEQADAEQLNVLDDIGGSFKDAGKWVKGAGETVVDSFHCIALPKKECEKAGPCVWGRGAVDLGHNRCLRKH